MLVIHSNLWHFVIFFSSVSVRTTSSSGIHHDPPCDSLKKTIVVMEVKEIFYLEDLHALAVSLGNSCHFLLRESKVLRFLVSK